MIRATQLTKRYGDKTAVDALDFTIEPGHVTGFLGPNGAGKSTTMRMIVGLDRPSSGTVMIGGLRYADIGAPLNEVGVLLDARAAHKRRTAYQHLLTIAATHRIPRSRVHEVMGITGLEGVAGKRVGGFSLGMSQRLGIAVALIGDPATVILDEPINGLDPDGILWARALVRGLAAEGRTVLLSSHLMSEMRQTADRLMIIGRGQLIADGPIDEVINGATTSTVRVQTSDPERLIGALTAAAAGTDALAASAADTNFTVRPRPDSSLEVTGIEAGRIAEIAAAHGIVLTELATHEGSLEEAYLALTQHSIEYQSNAATTAGGQQ